jgi:dTDP-glucose pyrophosphorylase
MGKGFAHPSPSSRRRVEIAMTIEQRLEKIEAMLALMVQQQVKEWYTTGEFAALVGKAEYTVRQWCRMGRIRAQKKDSGRGKHGGWAISHLELQRVQRAGLLPTS